MIILKRRIRNIANYLNDIKHGEEFRPVVELKDELIEKIERVGFNSSPENGDTVLPNLVGALSRFNADGKWQIHRDQPMEDRYIRTLRWSWKQWAPGGGLEEHEDFRDIYRKCYPRTHIAPPAVELTYLEQEGKIYIVSPSVRNLEGNHSQILHQINLLLECFGQCELVKKNLEQFSLLKTNRLNWQMLPPGKYPWFKIQAHLKEKLNRLSENTQSVIFDRQKTILSFKPDEQLIGTGGFSDYIAYVFKDRNIVVLECIRRGNAIYVFGNNWEQFSKLTKAEIIQGKFHMVRLIHFKGWKTKLARLMDGKEAA